MRRYKDPLFAPERKRHPALAFLVILLVFLPKGSAESTAQTGRLSCGAV